MCSRDCAAPVGFLAGAFAIALLTAGAGTASADTEGSPQSVTRSKPASSSPSHGTSRPNSASPSTSRRSVRFPAPAATEVTKPGRNSAPAATPAAWAEPAWSRRQVGAPEARPAGAASANSAILESRGQTTVAQAAASAVLNTDPVEVEPPQAGQPAGQASFGQIVKYTLFNVAPTVNPTQLDGQSPNGAVTGNLNAVGSDGAVLTYTVNERPDHGTVSFDADGTYTYTPTSEWAQSGGTDQFSVTVDSGSAFRLGGMPGMLQGLLHSLAQFFGLSAADTTEAVVHVSVSPTVQTPTATTDPPTSEPATPVSGTDEPAAPVAGDGPTTGEPVIEPVMVDPAPEASSTPPHLALAEKMVNEILPENNSYRNGTPTVRFTGVDGATSMYNESDCSSFVTELLKAAYNLTDAQFSAWTGFRRPGPQHYYDDALANKGFAAYSNVNSVESGDLFIIKYTGSQEANGHIVVITAPPTYLGISSRSSADGLLMYRLPILDVTSSPHGSSDSRAATHQDGVGTGFMRLYTDADGNLVTYQWNNYSNGIVYSTTDRLATFARVELPAGN